MTCKLFRSKTDFDVAVGNVKHAMKLIAIWPKTPQTCTMAIIWFFLLAAFFICISASYAGAFWTDRDFERQVAGLGQSIPMTVIAIKYGLFKAQIKNLKSVLESMEKDWENLKQISATNITSSRRHGIMTKYARIPKIFFTVYSTVVMVCWMLFAISPAAKRMSSTNHSTIAADLPMSSWYPFPTHETPIYEIICVAETVIGTGMVIAHTSIDGLLVTIIFHLCGQLEILKCCIQEFRTMKRSTEEVMTDVKFIAKRHESIINTAGGLERSFNRILLGQLIGGTLQICLAGFSSLQAMESSNATALVRFGLLLTMALQQMFIYSLAGDNLTSQGAVIRMAAYKANWYELPPSVCKSFLIIMVRAEKPITITAGKFTTMSLTSFTRLLRTSASYLSVLRAMNTDKLN